MLCYICISLITSDVKHLFHMFMSHLHFFFFWELCKWILKPPKHQTVKLKATQEASSALLLPRSLSTVLKCVLNRRLLFPLIILVLMIFSLVISLHSPCLLQALVSLQASYCTRLQSWLKHEIWERKGRM